jgi:hypothetical protein
MPAKNPENDRYATTPIAKTSTTKTTLKNVPTFIFAPSLSCIALVYILGFGFAFGLAFGVRLGGGGWLISIGGGLGLRFNRPAITSQIE